MRAARTAARAHPRPRRFEPHSSPQPRSAVVGATHAGADLPQWTPERRAAFRALVDQDFPDGRAAIEAVMKGPHRSPGAADRDHYRHPAETLAFFGFAPTMTVLDIGPGAGDVERGAGVLGVVLGYYTELAAPALAKHGLYIATTESRRAARPRRVRTTGANSKPLGSTSCFAPRLTPTARSKLFASTMRRPS